jgi:hypothetical protein
MGIGFKAAVAAAHTPGPWILDDPRRVRPEYVGYHHIDAGKGFHDEHTGTDFGLSGFMSEADARLIAAAPDLLDMLKRVLRASPVFERDCLYPEACEFVAKVEGRS